MGTVVLNRLAKLSSDGEDHEPRSIFIGIKGVVCEHMTLADLSHSDSPIMAAIVMAHQETIKKYGVGAANPPA